MVPKVSAEWEDIAYALQHEILTVEQISVKHDDNVNPIVKNCIRIG